ncbi:MAG TPA: aspartyl protease family protein [Candidatus Elarobacter sp.]|nr:aspartyl protease family protein [Candidatus Elarobacter sp.]HEV2738060.1 aspartyl protease family protein [Candidatus Elarobacter sp.]
MTSRLWRVLPAFFLLLPSAPAFADEAPPDVAAIRQHMREARAIPHAYRRTTVTTSSNGTTTTVRYAVRDGEWRQIVESGPFHTESGRTKNEEWHQNDNGQTVIDEPDPGAAKPEPTTTTVSRVHAPVEAWLIAELNKRGRGTREYVDPQTWRLVRDEDVTANGIVATVYDDFRSDGGRVFAHHWHVENGYARTTSDTRVTAYDADDVPPSAVAMPNSRRLLVTFPAGVPAVTLPSKFGAQHIVVRIMVGTRGLDFLLDTGASGITIDSGVARQLGLHAYAERSAVTAQRYTTARTIVPEMHIGELVMRDVAVQMIPDSDEVEPGYKAVGLLGFDFLSELGVTIDYEKKQVTAVREPDYVVPKGNHVIALDVRIGDGSPYVNVAVNGALSERFILDTGHAGTFMIFDAFARKHPEALVDKGGGGDLRNMEWYGVGGAIETRPYQLASVKIGALNFVDFVGYRVTNDRSYDFGSDDGVIGSDFLRLFTVGLDYASGHVYLVPNTAGRKAMGIRE